jgi:hypothetical protein
MHIVLEGIIPVEVGCILHGLCYDDKLVDLELINRELQILWGQLSVGRSERTPTLNKLLPPGQGLTPSMKAIQYWALLKYLPLALGRHISKVSKHWEFLLHLSHMVDLIFHLNSPEEWSCILEGCY